MTERKSSSLRKIKNATKQKKNQIFICWSGEHSKKIAEELKIILQEDIFQGELECFVSTQDIASGEDWYNKIRRELKLSRLGIMCITKENVKAPWIYFEAGAMIGNNLRVVPLLINCDNSSLENTPIKAKQSIQFYIKPQFIKMMRDIKEQFSILNGLTNNELDNRSENAYQKMKKDLETVLEDLKSKRYFSEKYIYPQGIDTMTTDTVYVSCPMSTLTRDEYLSQKKFLKELTDTLKECGFKNVYCPAYEADPENWDGITTAVKDNYTKLRQVQYLIVLYPKRLPTSSLVEIGYGIALCKNTVIFCRSGKDLPYMLNKAAEDIPHLHTRECSSYDDIIRIIGTDKSLFEVKSDE